MYISIFREVNAFEALYKNGRGTLRRIPTSHGAFHALLPLSPVQSMAPPPVQPTHPPPPVQPTPPPPLVQPTPHQMTAHWSAAHVMHQDTPETEVGFGSPALWGQ